MSDHSLMTSGGYFASRSEIGKKIGDDLMDLRFDNTGILALSPGGVVVAIEIAKKLHSLAGLLLLKHIYIPGENKPLGIINDRGDFTYDQGIPLSEIDEFESEYRGHLAQQRMEALRTLHTVGHSGVLDPHYFSGRKVIIVNDFTKTGTAFKAAIDFLKPIKVEQIILVSVVTNVHAIDTMHLLGDRLVNIHVTDKDFPSDHYFEDNELPNSSELIQIMEQVVLQW